MQFRREFVKHHRALLQCARARFSFYSFGLVFFLSSAFWAEAQASWENCLRFKVISRAAGDINRSTPLREGGTVVVDAAVIFVEFL